MRVGSKADVIVALVEERVKSFCFLWRHVKASFHFMVANRDKNRNKQALLVFHLFHPALEKVVPPSEILLIFCALLALCNRVGDIPTKDRKVGICFGSTLCHLAKALHPAVIKIPPYNKA